MAIRYSGSLKIRIFINWSKDCYQGSISKDGKHLWSFDELYPPNMGFGFGMDSSQAYDEMAESALCFGGYYSSHNRGYDVPEWAPPPEIADIIDEETLWNETERYVTRQKEKQS